VSERQDLPRRRLGDSSAPITEEWLRASGFRKAWMVNEHEPHWVLWIGDSRRFMQGSEDLGIELGPPRNRDETWFCWMRSDYSHSRGRFLHVRHISTQGDVIGIFQGLTGENWNPTRVQYGSFRYPGQKMDPKVTDAEPQPVAVAVDPVAQPHHSPSTRERTDSGN
jgi:hypothetical protein